jgi:hypothetical protein
MSTNVISFDRQKVKKGDVLKWDFDYKAAFATASTIAAGSVTVSLNPNSQVSYASPVTVNGLVVQVQFDTTNGVVGQEYLADVYATTSNSEKKHLLLIIIVEPNS